ncbi:hypothetical protein AK812_SmicGene40282 [Symbiodinium microadriaticum]|uniref:Uncharacterized protein n=1 Tax=Symbiodinium microadriaticum TaxID=2951 RepID=A0A1Q9C962_SYMMI|nr:hypothetical protein AK812_SmicGene40282 [Symbiodinium microadriaticum]
MRALLRNTASQSAFCIDLKVLGKMVKGKPLRLCSRSHSCATLYAGQSFLESQQSFVKQEPETIEEDLRAAEKRLAVLKQKARKIETMTGLEEPKELRKCGEDVLASPVVPTEAPTRPLATPARAPERALSSDAQPVWEAAFPGTEGDLSSAHAATEADLAGGPGPGQDLGAPRAMEAGEDSDDELIMDVDCDLRKGTIRITAREYRNYVSEDVAEKWMEIVIRNIKEGKVVIDSGFYSEAAMKAELKFDKDRIKAIKEYCTASRSRRRALTRRDKYQRHIVEYWIDVKTSGSLSKASREEFSQYVEIIDDNLQLPPPQLGNEALPCYDEEDDDDDDDGDEDDGADRRDDKSSNATPAGKRKRRGKTPSPKSKLMAKRKREKEEEVEHALEDIEKIPQVLTELLRVRIKIDTTLDKLKKTGEKLHGQAEELMKLHDELAELKAENGKGTPSEKTSRITMEEKKLRRTVLRPAGKAKAKSKDESAQEHESDVLLMSAPNHPDMHRLPWRKLVVSDKLLCTIAAGFMDECREVSDMLRVLAEKEKLPLFWGSTNLKTRSATLNDFWSRYRSHDAAHAVFQEHGEHLHRVLPLQIHADEGQTLKKSGVMVINFQSPMGFGITTSTDSTDAMALNYIGNTYATRFLYTVCTKRTYAKKNKFVLDSIIEALADELADLFYNGVSIQLGKKRMTMYVATIGLKGDWPVQARIGNLTRHFARSWFKGADTRAVCSFLQSFLENHVAQLTAPDPYLESMLVAFRSANTFLQTLYSSGLWLAPSRCKQAAQSGFTFLRSYQEIAHAAHQMEKTRFKLTPKLHAYLHIIDALASSFEKGQKWTWNPLADAVQLDEGLYLSRTKLLVGDPMTNQKAVSQECLKAQGMTFAMIGIGEKGQGCTDTCAFLVSYSQLG